MESMTTCVFGEAAPYLTRRLDAVQALHRDVHHHDVGMELLDERHATATVLGLPDHLKRPVLLEQRTQALAEERMIVDQENAHP